MSTPTVCPACGSANASSNIFCLNCGTRLAPAGPPMAPPAYPGPAAPAYPGYPSPPGYPTPYPPAYPSPYGAYPWGPPPRSSRAGAILSGTFEVWAKDLASYFVVFLVLAAITGVITGAVSLAALGTLQTPGVVPGTPASTPSGADLAELLIYAVAAIVASAILSSIVAGGMTEFAVRRFRGESMTIEAALRRGLERFLSILGANILLALILIALVIVPLIALLALVVVSLGPGGTPSGSAIALLCGLLGALVLGGIIAIYVYVAMSLYPSAIMMEGVGAVEGLRRSWAITKGHRLSLFGAILVVFILYVVVLGAITFPASFANVWVVSLVASSIASAIVTPWFVILAAVAYDLIVRPFPSAPAAPPSVPMTPTTPPTPAALPTPPSPPAPPTGPPSP